MHCVAPKLMNFPQTPTAGAQACTLLGCSAQTESWAALRFVPWPSRPLPILGSRVCSSLTHGRPQHDTCRPLSRAGALLALGMLLIYLRFLLVPLIMGVFVSYFLQPVVDLLVAKPRCVCTVHHPRPGALRVITLHVVGKLTAKG